MNSKALISRILLTLFVLVLSTQNNLYSQRRIKIRRAKTTSKTVKKPANTAEPIEISRNPQATKKVKSLSLDKKELWLAVGLSLTFPGGGHFYVGKYFAGSIFFFGSYGLFAAGATFMMSSHATRDIVVDGKIVRETDDTNKPLLLIGSIFLASGFIFYLGSVIDIFLVVSDYNRRVDRLRRYALIRKEERQKKVKWYLASRQARYYGGATMRF